MCGIDRKDRLKIPVKNQIPGSTKYWTAVFLNTNTSFFGGSWVDTLINRSWTQGLESTRQLTLETGHHDPSPCMLTYSVVMVSFLKVPLHDLIVSLYIYVWIMCKERPSILLYMLYCIRLNVCLHSQDLISKNPFAASFVFSATLRSKVWEVLVLRGPLCLCHFWTSQGAWFLLRQLMRIWPWVFFKKEHCVLSVFAYIYIVLKLTPKGSIKMFHGKYGMFWDVSRVFRLRFVWFLKVSTYFPKGSLGKKPLYYSYAPWHCKFGRPRRYLYL